MANAQNELLFGIVFVLLFLPPLVLLLLQIYRVVAYLRNRKAINWIYLQFDKESGQKKVNIHLLLKLAFAFINVVRLLQGFLFLGTMSNTSLVLDNAIRYWIPYITTNILFTCISILVYYWLELGIASVAQLGKVKVFPRWVTVAVVAVNVVFHVLTIILLAVFIKPEPATALIQGTPDTMLFQEIYFFVMSIPMLVLVSLGLLFVKYSIIRMSRKMEATESHKMSVIISKAYRKMGIFSIFVILAFAIRLVMNFLIVFYTFGSDTIQATLVFIWNAIPEIILSFAIVALMWVRKSSVPCAEAKEGLLAEEIVAPEISTAGGVALEAAPPSV